MLLCFDKATLNLTLEGNIQSKKIYSQTNSYLSLQIYRCQNSSDDPTATVCASSDEIEDWVYNKQLEPLAFNKKPGLKNYDKYFRIEFDQFEAVPLKPGIKSDLWFRFRENIYDRKDLWYWPTSSKTKFSSLRLDYRNWIQVPPEEIEDERIARLIYRNDDLQMEHEREVIQLEEFLGSIAGMYDLIMYAIFFIFGSYIDFMARVKWVRASYTFKDCGNRMQHSHTLDRGICTEDDHDHHEGGDC